MFSLIFARTNSWANNGDAGDLRRHRTHYDVIVIFCRLVYSLTINSSGSSKYGVEKMFFAILIHGFRERMIRIQLQTASQGTCYSPLTRPLRLHYSDVIMGTIAPQFTRLTIVYSTFIQTQIKENIKAQRHWPLCGDFPAQMASDAENVSIWWRHPGTDWFQGKRKRVHFACASYVAFQIVGKLIVRSAACSGGIKENITRPSACDRCAKSQYCGERFQVTA